MPEKKLVRRASAPVKRPIKQVRPAQAIRISGPLVEGGQYEIVDGALVPIMIEERRQQPAVKLAPGDYKTQDGRKARVWLVNKPNDKFPVIGAVETNGIWVPVWWKTTGEAMLPNRSRSDIVSKWSEG